MYILQQYLDPSGQKGATQSHANLEGRGPFTWGPDPSVLLLQGFQYGSLLGIWYIDILYADRCMYMSTYMYIHTHVPIGCWLYRDWRLGEPNQCHMV